MTKEVASKLSELIDEAQNFPKALDSMLEKIYQGYSLGILSDNETAGLTQKVLGFLDYHIERIAKNE